MLLVEQRTHYLHCDCDRFARDRLLTLLFAVCSFLLNVRDSDGDDIGDNDGDDGDEGGDGDDIGDNDGDDGDEGDNGDEGGDNDDDGEPLDRWPPALP